MNKRIFKKRMKQFSKRPEQIALHETMQRALTSGEHASGLVAENFFNTQGVTVFHRDGRIELR